MSWEGMLYQARGSTPDPPTSPQASLSPPRRLGSMW